MTVSRSIQITYDAADDETADWFADFLRRTLMGEPWGTFEDVRRLTAEPWPITGQAFMEGPVTTEWRAGS